VHNGLSLNGIVHQHGMTDNYGAPCPIIIRHRSVPNLQYNGLKTAAFSGRAFFGSQDHKRPVGHKARELACDLPSDAPQVQGGRVSGGGSVSALSALGLSGPQLRGECAVHCRSRA
jgi:hypothetical protein